MVLFPTPWPLSTYRTHPEVVKKKRPKGRFSGLLMDVGFRLVPENYCPVPAVRDVCPLDGQFLQRPANLAYLCASKLFLLGDPVLRSRASGIEFLFFPY